MALISLSPERRAAALRAASIYMSATCVMSLSLSSVVRYSGCALQISLSAEGGTVPPGVRGYSRRRAGPHRFPERVLSTH